MSTNAFSQLSRECARSDAQDRAQLRRLHEHVRQVTEGQRGGGQPQLDFLLDTATDLMRYLADGALPTQEELLNIVTRLVVNAECATNARVEQRGVHAPATQAATPPSAPVAPQEPDPGTQVQDAGLDLAVRPDGDDQTNDLNRMRIGQLLVQMGLAESGQVEDALEFQRAEGLRFGEALIRLGHLDPRDLREVLGLQSSMREYAQGRPEEGTPSSPPVEFGLWHESMLGEVLVSSGAITREQLDTALAAQRATGMRFGETLVRRGFCEWTTVRAGIRVQEKLRHGEPGRCLKLTPDGIFGIFGNED